MRADTPPILNQFLVGGWVFHCHAVIFLDAVSSNQLSPGIDCKERTEMKRQREAAQFFGYQKRLMQTGVRQPDAWFLQGRQCDMLFSRRQIES